MKISAIFFDIDGTLVSSKLHRITPTLLNELQRLHDNGVKLVISSGRPFHLIDNLEGFQFDAWITSNGCVVLDGDKVVAKFPLNREAAVKLAEICKSKGIPILCHTFDRSYCSLKNEITEWFASHHGLTHPEVTDVVALAGKEDIFEYSIIISSEQEAELLNPVRNDLTFLRWHPAFTDVLSKGTDKSTGIKILLDRWGMDPAETMAFGDGANDSPMFPVCGIGVAMGNAEDDVKAAADYVTTSVDEDGVIMAFKHFEI